MAPTSVVQGGEFEGIWSM